ncbi:MAG: fbiA, partial [Nocardioidaceae bacterium]|nr:fbiA [Nocardioidaceae bacterium]
TEMMATGYSLTDVTAALRARMGIGETVHPMSNDRIENNVVITDGADQRAVHVLEYLAKYADRPAEGFVPIGLDKALATTEAVKALAEADLVILGPSSPTLALEPILSLPALYDTLTKSHAKVLGVPPSHPDHPGLARAAGVAESAREQFDHLVDRWASGTAAEVLATGRELIAQ